MKLAIIGQGAIGSLYTHYLDEASPIVLARAKRLKTVAPKVLVDIEQKQHRLKAEINTIDKVDESPFDVILICVKHYQLAPLVAQLTSLVHANSCLVLIQNGMGGTDLLCQHFKDNPIIAGTTTDAVYAIDNQHFQVTAQGQLSLGIVQHKTQQDTQCRAVFALFEKHHPNVKLYDHIDTILFEKLAINAVINPLSAVLGVKNGDLLNYPKQVTALAQEVFTIYQAMNLSFNPQLLSNKIKDVMQLTANNYSSMLQDIRLQRQTEIEGVLGYLIQQASNKNLNIPNIHSYYQQIKQLENRSPHHLSPKK